MGAFVGDVLLRFRAGDGTTHVRALAYQSVFIALSGFIGLVGLANVLDVEQLRGVVGEMGRSLLSGSSGRLLQETIRQGSHEGSTAAIVGLTAAALAGTLAMAQLERSANRLAGSNVDRPGLLRYAVAVALALTVGSLLVAGALILGGGGALATGFGWSGDAGTVWAVIRWPLGIAVVAIATFLLFRLAPRSRITSRSSLLVGTIVAVILWVVFTALLTAYFALRSDAGTNPYGPLLAVIALLLWAMATSLAFHLGLSTAYEWAGARHPGEVDVVHVPGPPTTPDVATHDPANASPR